MRVFMYVLIISHPSESAQLDIIPDAFAKSAFARYEKMMDVIHYTLVIP